MSVFGILDARYAIWWEIWFKVHKWSPLIMYVMQLAKAYS